MALCAGSLVLLVVLLLMLLLAGCCGSSWSMCVLNHAALVCVLLCVSCAFCHRVLMCLCIGSVVSVCCLATVAGVALSLQWLGVLLFCGYLLVVLKCRLIKLLGPLWMRVWCLACVLLSAVLLLCWLCVVLCRWCCVLWGKECAGMWVVLLCISFGGEGESRVGNQVTSAFGDCVCMRGSPTSPASALELVALEVAVVKRVLQ